jgi:hypothetical protein
MHPATSEHGRLQHLLPSGLVGNLLEAVHEAMFAGARRQRPLVRQRLQLPDAGRRGLATATFAKPALLSRIYAPTSKVDRSQGTETLRSVDYLIKAGFIRQVRSFWPVRFPFHSAVELPCRI